jgi:hypothetical protein
MAALTLAVGLVATGCAAGGASSEVLPVPADPTPTVPSGGAPTEDASAQLRPSPAPGPDLVLPEEIGEDTIAEYTDWGTDDAIDQAWLLDPCRPTEYPTDRQRLSFRTTSRTGPEVQDARQLAVYPTADAAAEVLAGFRRALTACSVGTTPAGSRWEWTFQDVPGLGDDGLVAASTVGGGQFSPAGDRIAVTRVDAEVFLAYSGGEFGTAELDGGADDMRQLARSFSELL